MEVKMGEVGSQYALAFQDSQGAYLDGSKSYKLTIPANSPVKDFWSVVVYDPLEPWFDKSWKPVEIELMSDNPDN